MKYRHIEIIIKGIRKGRSQKGTKIVIIDTFCLFSAISNIEFKYHLDDNLSIKSNKQALES